MTIAAILQTKGHEVVTATASQKVIDVLALLAERRIGAVPVMAGDDVVGVISERDIIYRLHEKGAVVLQSLVEEVMTSPAITVTPEQTALNALAMMTKRRIRHLPVLYDGKLVGLVSIGDLVKRRIDGIEQEAAAMREYIRSS